MKPFNKKGVSLVELLASIVIFAIAIGLVAGILTIISNASAKILENGKANTQGQLITRILETRMQDFSPTDYSLCWHNSECIILENHFAYVFDPIQNDVVLEVYDPILEFEMDIEPGEILLDQIPIENDYFSLHSSSNIQITEDSNNVYIVFEIVLESSTANLYTFYAGYTFEILATP